MKIEKQDASDAFLHESRRTALGAALNTCIQRSVGRRVAYRMSWDGWAGQRRT